MFRYRMTFVGYKNGKQLWRGTGFDLRPGGMTWLREGSLERFWQKVASAW